MNWIGIAGLIVVAFVVFKFVVKPLFKVVAILALVLIAWWLLKGF